MEIRTTAPAVNNKRYVNTEYGGYNKCITIDENNGSVLANCTGYAWGRFIESANLTTCNLSRADAENWYITDDGYPRGQVAKQGAIACWRKGKTWDDSDGRGHVAFVEYVNPDGSIFVSQSSYGGKRFETKTIYPPYNYNGLIFQGFIYNPDIDSDSHVKMYGCDVSEFNDINTDLTEYDYVIIRACWGTNIDKKALEWKEKCEALGKPYGVYVYSYALDLEGAKSEADKVVNFVKDWNIQCGIWFDMEDSDNYKAKHNAMNPELITNICNTFCSRVSDYGYYTGIYASQSWFGTYIKTTDWDRWVANWGNNDGGIHVDTSSLGTMLQYTSNAGKFDEDLSYVTLEHYKSYPVSDLKPIEDDLPIDDEDVKEDEKEQETGSKIDWKRKLSSRKFWSLLAGLVIAVCHLFKIFPNESDVLAVLSAIGICVAYIFGESWVDASYNQKENN